MTAARYVDQLNVQIGNESAAHKQYVEIAASAVPAAPSVAGA
jgi:hypothetical protein